MSRPRRTRKVPGRRRPVGESPVNTMISNLASMNADRLVDEQVRNWAPYGLDGAGTLEVSAVVKQEQPGEDEERREGVFT